MKRAKIIGLVLALTIAWGGSVVMAQKADDGPDGAAKGSKAGREKKTPKGATGEKGEKGGRKAKGKSGAADGSALQNIGHAMNEELNLTDKQKAEIKKLVDEQVKAQRDEGKDSSKQDKEAQKKELEGIQAEIRKAKESKDDAKLKEAHQKMKQLQKESKEQGATIDPTFLASVSKILDEKQRPKFEEIVARYSSAPTTKRSTEKFHKALEVLNLSADQKKSIDKILKKFEDDAAKVSGSETGKDKTIELIGKLKDDIKAQLTDDQQAAFVEAMKEAGSKGSDHAKAGKGSGHEKAGKGGKGGGGKGESKKTGKDRKSEDS